MERSKFDPTKLEDTSESATPTESEVAANQAELAAEEDAAAERHAQAHPDEARAVRDPVTGMPHSRPTDAGTGRYPADTRVARDTGVARDTKTAHSAAIAVLVAHGIDPAPVANGQVVDVENYVRTKLGHAGVSPAAVEAALNDIRGANVGDTRNPAYPGAPAFDGTKQHPAYAGTSHVGDTRQPAPASGMPFDATGHPTHPGAPYADAPKHPAAPHAQKGHLRSKFRVDAVEATHEASSPHHASRHRVKLSPVHSMDDAHATSVTPVVFDIHSETAKSLQPGLEYFLDLTPVD